MRALPLPQVRGAKLGRREYSRGWGILRGAPAPYCEKDVLGDEIMVPRFYRKLGGSQDTAYRFDNSPKRGCGKSCRMGATRRASRQRPRSSRFIPRSAAIRLRGRTSISWQSSWPASGGLLGVAWMSWRSFSLPTVPKSSGGCERSTRKGWKTPSSRIPIPSSRDGASGSDPYNALGRAFLTPRLAFPLTLRH